MDKDQKLSNPESELCFLESDSVVMGSHQVTTDSQWFEIGEL
jgi:hypothetical protein